MEVHQLHREYISKSARAGIQLVCGHTQTADLTQITQKHHNRVSHARFVLPQCGKRLRCQLAAACAAPGFKSCSVVTTIAPESCADLWDAGGTNYVHSLQVGKSTSRITWGLKRLMVLVAVRKTVFLAARQNGRGKKKQIPHSTKNNHHGNCSSQHPCGVACQSLHTALCAIIRISAVLYGFVRFCTDFVRVLYGFCTGFVRKNTVATCHKNGRSMRKKSGRCKEKRP